jgi:hypothetical protein
MGPVLGHRDGEPEVRRERAVGRVDGPVVVAEALRAAGAIGSIASTIPGSSQGPGPHAVVGDLRCPVSRPIPWPTSERMIDSRPSPTRSTAWRRRRGGCLRTSTAANSAALGCRAAGGWPVCRRRPAASATQPSGDADVAREPQMSLAAQRSTGDPVHDHRVGGAQMSRGGSRHDGVAPPKRAKRWAARSRSSVVTPGRTFERSSGQRA